MSTIITAISATTARMTPSQFIRCCAQPSQTTKQKL
jgi:hypothetical protein